MSVGNPTPHCAIFRQDQGFMSTPKEVVVLWSVSDNCVHAFLLLSSTNTFLNHRDKIIRLQLLTALLDNVIKFGNNKVV